MKQLDCRSSACADEHLQFTSRTRHDLLGPVNTLAGFLELLAEERAGRLNETQRAWISHMRSAVDRLLRLVGTGLQPESIS